VAPNSFDRRFAAEQVTVCIHDNGREYVRSFRVEFTTLNQGVSVMFDTKGWALVEKAAHRRTANASKLNAKGKRRMKCKHGFAQPSDMEGCAAELAVAVLTGLEDWWVIPPVLSKAPDVGRTLQVRGGFPYKDRFLLVHPEDDDASPFIQATWKPGSQSVDVLGWMYGAEAKRIGRWTNFGTDHAECYAVHQTQLHDLCELPEDNFAWLRSLPTGYLKQIQEQEQYEKEHVGEFKF
jgi:hypothetical protein